jgi:hypothetical protein
MKAGSLYSMLEVDFVREFRARSRRAAVDVFSILPIWQTWKQHRNAMKINFFNDDWLMLISMNQDGYSL